MDYDNRKNDEINKKDVSKRKNQKMGGKVLKIGEKDYILEYGQEALFDTECLKVLTEFFGDVGEAESNNDMKSMIMQLANIPKITLTLFYAALIEHHGMNGDKTVPDKETAKRLIMQYISENKKGKKNFATIMGLCMARMQEDGFLKVIGLDGLLEGESPQIITKKIEK